MKTIIGIIILFSCYNLNAQTVTKMEQKATVENFKFKNYLDKPLYYLLTNDTIRKYEKCVFENKKPGVLSGIIIKMENAIEIIVYFKELKFTKGFEEDLNWDFQTVIQEKISTIEIYIGGNKIKIIE